MAARHRANVPTEAEWVRWQELIADGMEFSAAAKAVRDTEPFLTCTRFRIADPDRQAQIFKAARATRSDLVDKKVEEWALADDASDAMRQFWGRRWNHAYVAPVEITGADGGPIQIAHERRLTLADVITLARQLEGLGTGAGGRLPAAGPVLAELGEGERPAGTVPPRSGS